MTEEPEEPSRKPQATVLHDLRSAATQNRHALVRELRRIGWSYKQIDQELGVSGNNWSDRQHAAAEPRRALVRELRQSGCTYKQIEQELRARGMKSTQREHADAERRRALVRELRRSGWTYRQIGNLLGISRARAAQIAARAAKPNTNDVNNTGSSSA